MRFLETERKTLQAFLPGLAQRLEEALLPRLEGVDSPAISWFCEAGGPALLIPRERGGLGASAVEAVRVHRALGSLAPSLAAATTMHQFSVATLAGLAAQGPEEGWDLLQAIARDRLLVASGFAEGRHGSGILTPTMTAAAARGGGFVINGAKKPCSLSRSMDLLTASVALHDGEGHNGRFAVVLVTADSPGIERRDFWGSPVLAGTESDEVILRDVHIPETHVFYMGDPNEPDPVQVRGFLWFELLISATYVGIASALVERSLHAGKGNVSDRVQAATEVEGAMAALEGVARALMEGGCGPDTLARALFVRFAVQQAITRAAGLAAECLGGLAFVRTPDVGYLLAATRALAFHPPARAGMSPALAHYLAGEPLVIA